MYRTTNLKKTSLRWVCRGFFFLLFFFSCDSPVPRDIDTNEKPEISTDKEPETDTDKEPETDTDEEPETDTDKEPETDTDEEPEIDTDKEPEIDTGGDLENLSMYITDVFEYVYAPGQHAQSRSSGEKDKFIGKPNFDLYLGGFGGYIIAGFNHDVMNVEGEYDFEVFSAGVSPEPAIVYIMCDENGDGFPNETWYELKGSEFDHPETIRNYSLIYYKAKSDSANITWKDNQGNSGELTFSYEGKYTSKWWYPETKTDSIMFSGTRLPAAYVNRSTDNIPQNWVVPETLFTWGYAENNNGEDYDNTNKSNKFDISNAVDEDGRHVKIEHIRFIKVQTAVFQQAGWLNEVSSEVKGARDLHYFEKK